MAVTDRYASPMAFVGRERELTSLAAALQRAAEGEPTRVTLSGSVGIGVSRLLDELAERLADVPDVVLCRGRCYPPLEGTPYGALSSALADALATLPDDQLTAVAGPGAYDLAALIPSVAERLASLDLSPDAPPLEAPDQRGARVQESLLGVLERLAGNGTVCLVLEDLEYADPGTRDFVSALLRFSRKMPLALIVSYHPDELHRSHPAWRFVRSLQESRSVEHVVVPLMSRDEMVSLVESLRGDRPSLGFMAAVMEGSRGNPLTASQLVAAHDELDGMRLSDPMEEMLHARLAKLPPAAVRVLRVLAAARRPLSDELVLRLELADGHLSKAAIGAALESHLAHRTGDGIEIIHQLCAEAIDMLVLPAERQMIHAGLATLLADRPAEAAWHWDAATRPREARQAHLAAAADAERVEPGQTALEHYQRALELLEVEPAAPALLAAGAAAAEAAGAFRRAAALMEQAIERRAGGRVERLTGARRVPAPDGVEVGAMCELLGRYRRAGGDAVGARRALETAIQLIPDEPSVPRARALASLAQDLMLEGRFAQSAELAEQARNAARAAGSEALAELGHATCTLGVDVAYLGQLERGLELVEEATRISRQAGRLDDVVRAYANHTTLLDLDSRREAALAVVQEGIAEAERSGLGLTYGAFLRGNAADILFQLGRWTESERECRAAMEFPPAGVPWFSPILYLSLVLVESRADEEAARLVGRTLLQLEAVPAGQWSALVQRAAVSLALWRGDTADALQAAAQGWERVLETGDAGQIAASAATVLEACAAAGVRARQHRDWSAVAEAGALAEKVLPVAEQHLAASDLPRTLGARREAELYIATARAHADRLRGRDRAGAWAQLAKAWGAIPVPYQSAKALLWQAAALLGARDQRPQARDVLSDAWRIATELPARPLREAVRELADRGRIQLPEDTPVSVPILTIPMVAVGPGRAAIPAIADLLRREKAPLTGDRFGLSPRENAVLAVLAEGRTNREIAARLFISERTVAVHVRRILSKLGVAGRVEAAGLAIRLGLVPDDPLSTSLLGTSARR
jgi:DNA-binding CsgD family transcriptional regulator